MKFKRNSVINIAKSKIQNTNTKLEPLDYAKWQDFVEKHNENFIWNEDTEEGKKSLQNIENVPEGFKHRVLARLNKVVCFSEYNKSTNLYDISTTFYNELNWITIQFARIPKLDDLKIFVEMANYLDALLLLDGKKVIDEKYIEEYSE